MNSEQLKEKLKQAGEEPGNDHAARVHRAISWLRCAEQYKDEDEDVTTISLWIAFNACYAIDDAQPDHDARSDFKKFTKKLCAVDTDKRLDKLLWDKYSEFIRLIINNQFVFSPFWTSMRAGDSDWKKKFSNSKRRANRALANGETPVLLGILLDRLYVLRNQLLHGGATYQGGVNRDQVRDGKNLLLELMPIVVELVMDHPEVDWGRIYYPVINE